MAGNRCHTSDATTDATNERGANGALRCDCGCLLARLVPGGVEIKCRRCKTTHVVALTPELFEEGP